MMHLATQNNRTTEARFGSVSDITACLQWRQLSPKAGIVDLPTNATGSRSSWFDGLPVAPHRRVCVP